MKNNNLNNDTNSRAKIIGSGFEFCGGFGGQESRQNVTAANGKSAAAASSPTPNSVAPILKALKICGLERGSQAYRENYKAFFSIMLKVGFSRSMDILYAIESEERVGELNGIKNMPAYIMARLKEFIQPS